MKFLAVFVTLAAVAFGYPDTTTWTLNELSMALQDPNTDPILIPYLEQALNEMMYALHHGQEMAAITVAMPHVADYTVSELAAALQDPSTNPAHIPYLEQALDTLMDALYAGEDKPSITVVIPPGAVHDVPTGEPGFIDVWPIVIPEGGIADPVAPVPPVASVPSTPSSPLVQIIVNVKQAADVIAPVAVEGTPSPVHFVDQPGWGNFI